MFLHTIIAAIPMFVCAFWAITLLSDEREKNKSKISLGIFMIVGFLLFLGHAVFYCKDYQLYVYIDPIYLFASLAINPTYYLYIRFVTSDSECKKNKNWVILPALIIGLAAATLYILMSEAEKNAYIHLILYKEQGSFDFSILGRLQILILKTKAYIFGIQIIPVFYFITKLIVKFNKNIDNFYSNTEGKLYNWDMKRLIIIFTIALLSVSFNAIGKTVFLYENLIILPGVFFGILFYFLGSWGYKRNYTIENLEKEEEDTFIKPSFYEENRDNLKNKIIYLLETEQLYKQQNLRITDISNLLNTNRTYVSQIINNELESSFSDFVNRYRVIYAKELIADAANRTYSLNYISEQSGFSSLNSFLRAFKKEEEITPGQFRTNIN